MCNAFNHGPECNCGFGGHDGSINENDRFKALTVPNARCPKCGALVFFYQSKDGGRVFFDSLGPPWPKHPCTNAPISVYESIDRDCFDWITKGWSPFLIDTYVENSRFYFLSGRLLKAVLVKHFKKGKESVLSPRFDTIVKNGLIVRKDTIDLASADLVFLKEQTEGRFLFSYYLVELSKEIVVEVLVH